VHETNAFTEPLVVVPGDDDGDVGAGAAVGGGVVSEEFELFDAGSGAGAGAGPEADPLLVLLLPLAIPKAARSSTMRNHQGAALTEPFVVPVSVDPASCPGVPVTTEVLELFEDSGGVVVDSGSIGVGGASVAGAGVDGDVGGAGVGDASVGGASVAGAGVDGDVGGAGVGDAGVDGASVGGAGVDGDVGGAGVGGAGVVWGVSVPLAVVLMAVVLLPATVAKCNTKRSATRYMSKTKMQEKAT